MSTSQQKVGRGCRILIPFLPSMCSVALPSPLRLRCFSQVSPQVLTKSYHKIQRTPLQARKLQFALQHPLVSPEKKWITENRISGMWERNLGAENLPAPIKPHYRDSNQTPLSYTSLPLLCLLPSLLIWGEVQAFLCYTGSLRHQFCLFSTGPGVLLPVSLSSKATSLPSLVWNLSLRFWRKEKGFCVIEERIPDVSSIDLGQNADFTSH